jgi:hypothetical protein
MGASRLGKLRPGPGDPQHVERTASETARRCNTVAPLCSVGLRIDNENPDFRYTAGANR